jgi:hypothetical protein
VLLKPKRTADMYGLFLFISLADARVVPALATAPSPGNLALDLLKSFEIFNVIIAVIVGLSGLFLYAFWKLFKFARGTLNMTSDTDGSR